MIEVGEYIRTRKGITKIEKVNNKKGCALCENSLIVNIKTHKHSKNIIDLIEEGDYVNGIRINKKFAIKTNPVTNHEYLEYNYGFENVLNDFEIKTILTHEQYEQNSYKVGDIE